MLISSKKRIFVVILWLLLSPLLVTAANIPNTAQSATANQTSASTDMLGERLRTLANQTIADLQNRIDNDAPYLPAERASRLERIRLLPDGNDPELTEKYRRILEAYRIELDYAKSIETYQDVLHDAGSDRLVEFLRVGRLGFFYQSLDGRESGVWDSKQRQWRRLSSEDNEDISLDLRIAKELEPPQLMMVPLFGPESLPRSDRSSSENTQLPWTVAATDSTEMALAGKEGLFAALREFAANLKSDYPWPLLGLAGLTENNLLDRLADSRAMTTPEGVAELFALLNKLLDAQSRSLKFNAAVYAPTGVATEREVVRIGDFGLIADGRYLAYNRETARLAELSRQPGSAILAQAGRFGQESASLCRVAIDASSGQTLQLLVQIPSLAERIDQGGPVGYLILLLAGLALALSVYRFAQLTRVGQCMRSQLLGGNWLPDNPLGRILSKLEHSPMNDDEALYLVIEDALAAEQAKLDYGLTFLKLIAAIAPMLGLLGTVTGMIETFQAIALHGSGDPKLMSGGISEALVTTVEGLVTAIPILLLHSLLSGKSQALGALLEAHASAALAQRLEARHPVPGNA
ncbi:MAG: DUF3450 family protein [Methylomicrobium sp.]|jgi:Protein of unknown function (DUF3450)/MotA/TolQ/ExbB proton channel family|nr:DUF3450 family protein [Methylomicrobium sp.]